MKAADGADRALAGNPAANNREQTWILPPMVDDEPRGASAWRRRELRRDLFAILREAKLHDLADAVDPMPRPMGACTCYRGDFVSDALCPTCARYARWVVTS